ncbi:hypothetical protein GLOTRDRAFT_126540 [Gloeophyllum trabeum ATCC 11539]|uniref:Uncharacterized protein n=1 Tax=Gloeophyllum trabeum (strain ATCC 11539 / FP-39264 / Madison 617) TaxID=670483 RepID=S7QE23_GLOTA|nr:uncharacterized protein GLOTRDRAFT_126540 [Gloeophyllum trabeum ATCC 11539]XP_007871509.1 uncharacterized protein GLOTRDRAFT_134324 [Gloeophyllum trabeum ATCC 11539]EPQ50036.1 hypothetical protein GLOTRDRAFT_134324 [Gloeophyllum trabeum ATCC 11539]EPQ58051.1 hypothetical protein GLOTRDRAFT_126540 [Gloeophyllum trabeum ATCC 11539]
MSFASDAVPSDCAVATTVLGSSASFNIPSGINTPLLSNAKMLSLPPTDLFYPNTINNMNNSDALVSVIPSPLPSADLSSIPASSDAFDFATAAVGTSDMASFAFEFNGMSPNSSMNFNFDPAAFICFSPGPFIDVDEGGLPTAATGQEGDVDPCTGVHLSFA